MTLKHACTLALAWAVCVAAHADTVHFKDGSSLDGEVSRPNPNCVAITVGGGRMVFPATDVASIEENEKEGAYSLNEVRARHHSDMMRERTGLTRDQRDQVRGIVTMLEVDDPVARRNAREELKALSAEMPIYQYLEACLPYTRGKRVAEMMQVMTELDPERSKNMLMIRSQDINPVNRAKSLELIADVMQEDGVERLAQGMLDDEPAIQIAATQAIAKVGDKRASLALAKGLDSNDPQVRNASKVALTRLWSTENATVEFETAGEWRAFLNAQRGQMPDAIDPKVLQPLVVHDPDEEPREYVDE